MMKTPRALVPGIIIERDTTADSGPPSEKYRAQYIEDGDSSIGTGWLEPERRVATGAEVLYARPGDHCLILLNGKEITGLWVQSGIPFAECPELDEQALSNLFLAFRAASAEEIQEFISVVRSRGF
jgi:hypothetical protein